MANITFAITENIAVIGNGTKGWQKEVNMVSWNGAEPKMDIRDWAPDHAKMGKGIVLSADEATALAAALAAHLGSEDSGDAEPAPKSTPVKNDTEDLSGFTDEQKALIEKAKALMAGGK